MTKQELQELINESVEIKLEEMQEADRIFEEEGEDIIKEAYMDLYIAENTEEDEVLEEGANLESREAFKTAKKEYKVSVKEIKKAIKAGDKEGAKKACKDAKASLEKTEKIIKDTPSDAGSVILGYFATGILEFGEVLLVMGKQFGISVGVGAVIGSKAMHDSKGAEDVGESLNKYFDSVNKSMGKAVPIIKVAAIATFIKPVVVWVKAIKQFIVGLKDADLSTADKMNLYKNRLLSYVTDLKKKLDKLEKSIK